MMNLDWNTISGVETMKMYLYKKEFLSWQQKFSFSCGGVWLYRKITNQLWPCKHKKKQWESFPYTMSIFVPTDRGSSIGEKHIINLFKHLQSTIIELEQSNLQLIYIYEQVDNSVIMWPKLLQSRRWSR